MVNLEKLAGGADTTLAQAARLLIIVFSIVGSIVLPFMVWMSHEAYLSFASLSESVRRTELTLAGYEVLRVQRSNEIAVIGETLKEHGRLLWEHEKRLARIELAQLPPASPPSHAPDSQPPKAPHVAIEPTRPTTNR